MHAVVHALRDELREHGGGDAVLPGVAEVFLPGPAERGVDDELLGFFVVGGRGGDGGDIRTVPRLGHRERAGHLEAHDVRQKSLVVIFGAEVKDRGGEQAPLHAGLDLQRRARRNELLEGRDVAAVVFETAELLRKRTMHLAALHQDVQLAERALPLFFKAETLLVVQLGILGKLAGSPAHIRPGAHELGLETLHIDGCLCRRLCELRIHLGVDGVDFFCLLLAGAGSDVDHCCTSICSAEPSPSTLNMKAVTSKSCVPELQTGQEVARAGCGYPQSGRS